MQKPSINVRITIDIRDVQPSGHREQNGFSTDQIHFQVLQRGFDTALPNEITIANSPARSRVSFSLQLLSLYYFYTPVAPPTSITARRSHTTHSSASRSHREETRDLPPAPRRKIVYKRLHVVLSPKLSSRIIAL